MNKKYEIHTTAICGCGALGLLFAGQITDALGFHAASFVADQARVEAYRTMHFSINGAPRQFSFIESEAAVPVDLLIIAVKYNGLAAALDTAAPCVGPDTTIISVMNGISSEEIIGERFGKHKVLGCIAQGMDAVKFGGSLTYSKPGELRVGVMDRDSEEQRLRMAALTAFFDRAGVPYTVESDIRYRLWGKFMLNVGVNQTCMAFETNYGGAMAPGKPFDTMTAAMREVIALANLEGVPLTEKDLTGYLDLISTLSPEGMPSMRQDGVARRPSEVEMFAGTVRALAARHGLDVPVNDWLYKRIKELESGY